MKVFKLKDGKLQCTEGTTTYQAKEGSEWISRKEHEAEVRRYQGQAVKGNPYPLGSTESFMRELFR